MENKQLLNKKKYFIGIDSDGTVFDSMTIKHMKAFIPEMISQWGLEEHEDAVYETGANINLYSQTRGINRFSGLCMCFEQLHNKGVCVPDFSDLSGFVNSKYPMSEDGLKDYIRDNKSLFLEQVLAWSRNGDRVFGECVKNLEPFNNVANALDIACNYADIGVVSSASEKSLHTDWSRAGLMKYVSVLYGQEFGSKTEQLKETLNKGYDRQHILMIGDAPGDLKAAESAGIAFYPIIPGLEEESWENLVPVLELFFDGKYDSDLQTKFCDNFKESLI